MKKVSAAVAAVLVSGAAVATTVLPVAPAYAQDRARIATPASTAATWQFTGMLFADKSDCIDAGQQYEREGFPYQCRYGYFSPTKQYLYWLYIQN